jgi:septal ring factor EnvC (AmiA/AmiB activator)
VTLQLGWLIAWSLGSAVVGGLIVAFVTGRKFGEMLAANQATHDALAARINGVESGIADRVDTAVQLVQVRLQADIDNARMSRARIHRDIEEQTERLREGEQEFSKLRDATTRATVEVDALTEDTKQFRIDLNNYVSRVECDRRHAAKGT